MKTSQNQNFKKGPSGLLSVLEHPPNHYFLVNLDYKQTHWKIVILTKNRELTPLKNIQHGRWP